MSLGHGRTPINKGLPYIFERVAWRRIGEFSPGWGTGAAWPDGGTRPGRYADPWGAVRFRFGGLK